MAAANVLTQTVGLTALQAAQAKNNDLFTLATDFWIPEDDSRWIQE